MMTKYSTKDFYLSAYLLALGHRLANHKREDGITLFEFDDTKELDDNVSEYYSLTASVNPVSYGNSIRTLKTILHSNENEHTTKSNRTAD